MMLAGAPLASCALASETSLSTATEDAWASRPIDVLLNGVSWRDWVQVNTLQIDDTLGEQVSATFTIVNPTAAPVVGTVVEVRYYAQTLFSGTIDRITRATNNTQTYKTWDCTCTDWSQILMRHIIRRNFSYVSVQQLVESLLQNELAGEALAFGTADKATSIPYIDSQSGRAFDVLRDSAGVTGQTFYVDFDKRIQFRATTNDAAPLDLDLTTVELATVKTDRETYRNIQIVTVTGTPPNTSTDALTSTIIRQNDNQITARAAIEGGTGRYENYEDVTHPTSNDGVQCQLMAIGYAQLRLAVSGVPRETLTCRVRAYGFRAGQFASLDLASLGVSGTWLIQRVSLHDEDGKRLIHEMELVRSSLQQRAYESWLAIVKAGKLVVQMPSAITTNSQVFNTPGATTWTVPAGVTVAQFTCIGGSGGGGGGAVTVHGGMGGNSGKAVTIRSVVEGDVYTVLVGSAGTPGANEYNFFSDDGTDGTNGTLSSVGLSGTVYCQGDAGGGGTRGRDVYPFYGNGIDGSPGSGIGDAVSVGGGQTGGMYGTGTGPAGGGYQGPEPLPGMDGNVEVNW